MNKKLIYFIKCLYYDDNLTDESIDHAFEKLKKDLHLTKYESICDFENNLIEELKNFKSEILDYLLILLAQLKDIEEVKEVYDKMNTIQSIIQKFLKQVAEAEYEAREAKDIEAEKAELEEIYGYKPDPDELPIYRC